MLLDGCVDQERRLEDRNRLDTVLVPAVNDADWMVYVCTVREKSVSVWALGIVCSQEGNLKRLTEGHHQEWSVRLNLTQRGTTYQCLVCLRATRETRGGGAWPFEMDGVSFGLSSGRCETL